jgi:hypothetical protein
MTRQATCPHCHQVMAPEGPRKAYYQCPLCWGLILDTKMRWLETDHDPSDPFGVDPLIAVVLQMPEAEREEHAIARRLGISRRRAGIILGKIEEEKNGTNSD